MKRKVCEEKNIKFKISSRNRFYFALKLHMPPAWWTERKLFAWDFSLFSLFFPLNDISSHLRLRFFITFSSLGFGKNLQYLFWRVNSVSLVLNFSVKKESFSHVRRQTAQADGKFMKFWAMTNRQSVGTLGVSND